MRKLLLLTLLALLVTSATEVAAQDTKSKISVFASDKLTVMPDSKTFTLEGNVSLTSGKLEIFRADSVSINKETNKLTVFGNNEFFFNGKIIVFPTTNGKHTILEYTVGEDVAYRK